MRPKATFVAKADAVCGSANAQLGAILPPSGHAAVATTAATFVTAADATQVRSLRSLQMPGRGDRVEAPIEKVAPICAKFVHDIEAIRVLKTMAELNWYLDRSTELYNAFVTEVKALPVPSGDEPRIAELAKEITDLGSKLRELGGAAINGDVKRVNLIEKEGDALADAVDAKFAAYGFSNCGA